MILFMMFIIKKITRSAQLHLTTATKNRAQIVKRLFSDDFAESHSADTIPGKLLHG